MNKAKNLMDFVEQEDVHEDEDDTGRLEEMIDRMDIDHLLSLIAYICEAKADTAEEEGYAQLADTWRKDSEIIREASKKVG